MPYSRVELPPGEAGDWLLERFEVRGGPGGDPAAASCHDCARRRPGTYTRLKRGDTVFMTDLYDEWYTQRIAIDEIAQRGGRVLISGLGLGLILEAAFRADGAAALESVTVLERSPEVIELVGPSLEARFGERLEIVEADVFTWVPPQGARYTVVWHDIWPNPQAPEVASEVLALERRYGRYCDWHGCWPVEFCRVYEGRK